MKKLLRALRSVLLLALVFALVAAVFCGVDSLMVFGLHKKPLFTPIRHVVDDGGSGRYTGFGYSFVLEGNFLPEDHRSGVTQATLYLLGFPIVQTEEPPRASLSA